MNITTLTFSLGNAEGEGAYVFQASGGVAQFKLSVVQPRFYPAFKITSWNTSSLPQIVFVDNQEQILGYHYNATIDGANNQLIIQFNQVFTGASTRNFLISQKNSLAVTLTLFEAVPGEGVDTLRWTTQSETDNLGFYLLRREKPLGDTQNDSLQRIGLKTGGSPSYVQPNPSLPSINSVYSGLNSSPLHSRVLKRTSGLPDTTWRRLRQGLIPGPSSGRSSSTRNYRVIDGDVQYNVTYEYKLVSVDFNQLEEVFGPVEATPFSPIKTKLHGNYPNPFNPITVIRFDLKERTPLTLKVFNLKGRLIRTLIYPKTPLPAGQYRYTWDAKDDYGMGVPSGHYIYLFVTPKYKKARKMTLLK